MRQILTGNQAVALGALRAGVKVVTGYPGTPSTGCLTHLLAMDLPERHVEWSTNEKVSFEIAAGAAWAGHRAMCTMKMSGLNVAYDALISIAYSGTNGGLVVYVADDPGVSAGMAEQDSRGFAMMSHLPMLEPATPAQTYELVQTAFELSEAVGSPVFLRLTTAVSLGHAVVEVGEPIPPREIEPILEKDIARYTKAGAAICQQQHRDLIERLERAGAWVHDRKLNGLELAGEPGGLGIVAAGAVNAYLDETIALAAGKRADDVSTLKLRTTIPFPWEETKRLLEHCGTILVLEELEPHVERTVYVTAQRLGFDGPIVGKLDGTLSPIGEYGIGEVFKGLVACGMSHVARGELYPPQATSHRPQASVSSSPQITSGEPIPAPRLITVCAGCPHRGTYLAIDAAIEEAGYTKDDVMVTGDIGCTILGMNPPFDLLWNEVSMGSSVGLAQGYVHAGLETPVIATIGDSTFFHGGIPGLINAIQHRVPLTLVVMDNGWTAMTGMQVNPGSDNAFQEDGRRIDLEQVIRGLGVERLFVVDPYDLTETTNALGECLRRSADVSVVLARRECAIQAARRGVRHGTTTVDPETCVLCKQCLRVTGCPALSLGESSIRIDSSLCNGCGLCVSFCPTGAIVNSPGTPHELTEEEPAAAGSSDTSKEKVE
jgi:indolepyruvate ferredoxin oxidoreductase alpha subunit